MKKNILKALSIFLTMISFSLIIQSENDPFKQPTKRSAKVISFTPDEAFGGQQAQGKYKKRGKTVTITNGNETYLFNTITEDLNPTLHPNKLNLVTIGYFSNKNTRADMPVTTYLFGLPSNDSAKIAVQNIANGPELINDQFDSVESFYQDPAPLSFKPAKQFNGRGLIGNYFSITNTATIYDPSGKNNQKYTFEKVQEKHVTPLSSKINKLTDESILIGSYISNSQCSKGTPKICSHAVKVINLYGTLQHN